MDKLLYNSIFIGLCKSAVFLYLWVFYKQTNLKFLKWD